MSLHTPGPWEVAVYQDPRPEIRETVGDIYGIRGKNLEDERHVVFSVVDFSRIAHAKANAHLIAAAPDLLAACEKSQEAEMHFRECEECDQDDGSLCEVALELHMEAERLRKAAIAKAKGKQS